MWTDGDCHVMSFRNYARDAKKEKKTRSYESLCYKGSGVWIVDESEKVANALRTLPAPMRPTSMMTTRSARCSMGSRLPYIVFVQARLG